MNRSTLTHLIAALGIALCAYQIPAARAAEPGVLTYPPNSPRLASLDIETVHRQTRPIGEPFNGRVVYDEDRTSRVTAPVTGRVIKTFTQVGDAVTKGAALLWLDSPELGSAEADAAKAEADLAMARAGYQRAEMLYQGNVLARKDFEQAEADFHKAEAELRRAQLRLRNLGIDTLSDKEDFSLRSAVAGVVTERHVNPGMEVRPDLADPLFVVTDPTHLWIYVDVPEKDISRLHPGQAVEVRSDAYPELVLRANVHHVGDVLDSTTRRLTATLAVANPKRLLKPGMFVRVAPLADGDQRAFILPNSAFITEGGHTYVFVATQPGELRKRAVTLGMQGREWSVVESGLRESEQVVTHGALLLNADLQGS